MKCPVLGYLRLRPCPFGEKLKIWHGVAEGADSPKVPDKKNKDPLVALEKPN